MSYHSFYGIIHLCGVVLHALLKQLVTARYFRCSCQLARSSFLPGLSSDSIPLFALVLIYILLGFFRSWSGLFYYSFSGDGVFRAILPNGDSFSRRSKYAIESPRVLGLAREGVRDRS